MLAICNNKRIWGELMPVETQEAVNWALNQTLTNEFTGEEYPITADMAKEVVDHVLQYFNDHNIEYSTFSYEDLKLYLT
jgi:hypothetical protein